MSSLSVPTRTFLQKWSPAIILVLLLVALLGGWFTYSIHTGPDETITEEEVVGTWTVESSFDHAATVRQDTRVFQAGDRFEQRPLYFTRPMPELDITHTLEHENSDGNEATATVELSFVLRSVDEMDDQEVVHWEERETLATEDASLASGERMTTDVDINVTEADEQITEIQQELGASPGVAEIVLVADVSLESNLAGESMSDQREELLFVTLDGATYRIETDDSGRTSSDVTEETTTVVEPSPIELYGPLVVLVAGVAGAVFVGFVRSRGAFTVSPSERRRYEYESIREDFDEWISEVELPTTPPGTTYRVGDLSALVDIAIDSNRRVLQDDSRFWVAVDDIVYVYEAPVASMWEDSGTDEPAEPTDGGNPEGDDNTNNDSEDS